ncbi:MAG: CbtB-domain containing protein [Planctomycetes bacterium]|nr:CbtB-domain containing protein [Planctomycetota bacterium]
MASLLNRHIRLTRTLHIDLKAQAFLLFAIVAVVLYAVFFSTTPAVHDFFHEIRHSMMIIPCH